MDSQLARYRKEGGTEQFFYWLWLSVICPKYRQIHKPLFQMFMCPLLDLSFWSKLRMLLLAGECSSQHLESNLLALCYATSVSNKKDLLKFCSPSTCTGTSWSNFAIALTFHDISICFSRWETHILWRAHNWMPGSQARGVGPFFYRPLFFCSLVYSYTQILTNLHSLKNCCIWHTTWCFAKFYSLKVLFHII